MNLNIFGWGWPDSGLPAGSRAETELLELADQSWRVTRQPEPYTGSMRAYGFRVLLSPLTWAYHALRSFGQGYARSLIYYASSPKFKKKLDYSRLEKSRETLRAIGGQTIAIRTEDGVVIETMFFDVNTFHDRIVALGGLFKTGRDHSQILISTSYRLSELLRELKIDNIASCGFRVSSSRPDGAMIISARPNAPFIPSIRTKHVAILTQGNGGIFIFGKAEITETLMKGMSCMVFNIRGTGRSDGHPTEIGTYYDIEAVYRYLRMRGFSDHQISVHGYCLGAALACELAHRHPVNLLLRTPFASISDVIADIATCRVIECFNLDPDSRKTIVVKRIFDFIISKLVSYLYISYDNEAKVRKIKTRILLIESSIDEVLFPSTRERLRAAVASTPRATIHVTDQMGHNDEYDSETLHLINSFLRRHDLLRDFPTTLIGLSSQVAGVASEVAGICSDASVQSAATSEASVHLSLPSNGAPIHEAADI